MLLNRIIPEKHHRKIAAVFEDRSKAKQAEQTLVDYGHFDEKDVQLVEPGDDQIEEKLEPETEAIGTTLLTSHFVFGSLGLVSGLVLAFVISQIGPAFAQSSPFLLHLALGMIGLFFGLFVAGAITLRPDHDPLINDTLEASRQSQWAVIVQARDRGDQQRARQLLMPAAISVTDTF